MPDLDSLVKALPSNVRTQEPARERIPRTVRIHNQFVRDRRHRVHLCVLGILAVDDDGRLGSLRDHDDARPRVGLGVRRDALGDHRHVGRVGFEDGLGVLLRFRFVPDDDVGVAEGLRQLLGEEFGNERRGEVEDEGLRGCVCGVGA